MAKIQLEDYGIWYDDETDLIFDEDGECRSNVPNGTFPFKGKLYTYGTKVRIKDKLSYNSTSFVATFKQDTEMKQTRAGFGAVPIAKAREYYDGKPFELDDVFIQEGGNKRIYLSTIDFENGIVEIISPVFYTFPSKTHSSPETPPPLSGYRTVVNSKITDSRYIRYKDHLYNCEVDTQGNVTDWFEPMTFGHEKYVYTVGTKAIIKHRNYGKSFYYVGRFDGTQFVFDGYPTVPITVQYNVGVSSAVSTNLFKAGRNSKGVSIAKIIEPHYYRPAPREMNAWDKFKVNGGPKPVDTSFGTFIYIVVMIGGAIFKDRILLWVAATLIYLLWRFGYMNKK